ncbi:MAG: protease inhibitor I42 family protein [Clostridia bacterium]|nr:protease inhibitor I42 family protein [Clostridia bacterium]
MAAILQKIVAFFTAILVLLGILHPGTGQLNENEGYEIDGATVTFHFLANPTTGYDWTVTQEGDALTLTEEHYTQDPAPPGFGGVGGVKYYTLTAGHAGSATLRFVYGRSWEDVPARIITAELTVDANGTPTVTSLTELNPN